MDTGQPKMWGSRPFWGVTSQFDPTWTLTSSQKRLQNQLMELCRLKIRPHAIHCDRTYTYPRESLNTMAQMGLLGLIVPKSLGGRGETHVCAAMVVETLARYGCPSTAMIYTMHLGAVTTLLFRYHGNSSIRDLLQRLDRDKLVGTLSYSDPATGGHFWFPLSSKCSQLDRDHVRLLKFGSWATSAGFADWYAIQTVSPGRRPGDFADLSCFLIMKDEVRANSDDWESMGMHGNQSGPLVCEGVFTMDRMIGPPGDGIRSNDECVDTYFLLLSSSCWNGIAMATMDLVKEHVTRKSHGDVGMRVCDYPTIQDYFGECMCDTTASRLMNFSLAAAMDSVSENNDWSGHEDLDFMPRSQFLHWLWQMKFTAARNVNHVVDKMLHAAGGSGYKTDLGLERLLRDGKAGWVMGPSNEVLRQYVGQTVLLGMECIDYWDQKVNERVVHHETKKMTSSEKEALARDLLEQVQQAKQKPCNGHANRKEDFDNPFNSKPPAYFDKKLLVDGKALSPGLHPDRYVSMKLTKRTNIGKKMCSFLFSFENDHFHSGCYPGQYVKMRVAPQGSSVQERYFSPVSNPLLPGGLEVIVKFETSGIFSQHFKQLSIGDSVEVTGPSGGFEYHAHTLEHLTLIASGAGATPALQLTRCVMSNPHDSVKVTLIYFSESADDILLKEELDSYAVKDLRFSVCYTLGEVPEDWHGEEGFIDKPMLEQHVPKYYGLHSKIVLCGGPSMIISTLSCLRELRFPACNIFVYGQFGTEHVRMVYGRNVPLSGHTSLCTV